ncbi:MAG: adenine deaminase, partial [Cytophagia bacterium]|nr:adenine deaminase [Cytophagia bacterium]
MKISGHIVDVRNRRIFDGLINIENDRITSIEEATEVEDQYVLPGFIDSHVHIESSMLVPSEFARLAVVHGTVATVSDPHEIGNVLGVEGVEYMIENGKKVNFKFNFGAPSCVPATTFETAGAEITPDEIEYLLKKPEVKYLAEMMNWPGVLFKDETVYKKIDIAKKLGKPIDGHAPGLRGDQA